MPKLTLSDVGLRSIQHPEKGNVDYWDTKFPSFGVRVGKQAITFVLNIDKTRRAIGRYPLVSLSEARTEAKRLLAEKTLGKVRPASITFPQATELFLKEKRVARRQSTVDDLEDRLSRHFPLKGQLVDANHQYVGRRLAKIKTNPEHNSALRVARTFFTWAVNRRYLSDNPTIGFEFRSTQSRSRVLSDEELGTIWKVCERHARTSNDHAEKSAPSKDASGSSVLPTNFARIVQLLLLTGQRRNEIASLRTPWLDLKNGTLTIPAQVAKNNREHHFPIGKLATSILEPLVPLTGQQKTNTLLFPARGKPNSPFSGWSKAKAQLDKLSGVKDWTLHDLRRTFATTMANLEVEPHIIERLLNHISGQVSGVAAVYNRASYLEPMKRAIDRYEEHLQTIFAQG